MNFKQIISILFCFSIYSRGLFLNRGLFGFDIDLFAYPFFIFLFFYLIFTRKFRLRFFLVFFIIELILFFPYFFSQLPISGYFKVCLPLLLILPSVYSYLYNQNLYYFFKNYIKVSKWVAIIGLIQFALKIVGVSIFSRYTNTVDLHSIVTEPSHYVVVMLPAFVFTYFHYKSFKKEFWIILISLILTFKVTAFLSLFLIYIIIKRKIRNLIFILPLGYLFYLYIISFDQFSFRLLSILDFYFSSRFKGILHGTPLSFLSNLNVAIESANSFLFGGGVGSHPYAYDLYFKKNEWIGIDYQFGINKNSGHSLTIRLLSEFGYAGLIIFISFFVITFNKLKHNYHLLTILFAVMAHFIAKSIKLGGYIDFGTPIFFSLLLVIIFKKHDLKSDI